MFTSLVIKTLIIAYLVWRVRHEAADRPDRLSLLYAPLAGVLGTALVHALWDRLGRARRDRRPALGGSPRLC